MNHDQFSRLNGSHIDKFSYIYEVYGQISFNSNIKELMTLLDDVRQDGTLNQTISKFLEQGSTCVLPQSRGYEEAEKGDLFWNLKTAEERIVKAYLRYSVILRICMRSLSVLVRMLQVRRIVQSIEVDGSCRSSTRFSMY